MKKLIVLCLILISINVFAADRYIAPDGADSGDGNISAPWATIKYAFENCTTGDCLYLRAGTHTVSERIWTKNYDKDNLTIKPYNSESVIINGAAGVSTLFDMEQDNIKFYDLTINCDGKAIGYGYDLETTGGVVENCIINMRIGGDNVGCLSGGIRGGTYTFTNNSLNGPCVDGSCILVTGTAEAGTLSTVQDTDKSWEVNQWYNFEVTITSGTGSGSASYTIESNTSNTLTIDTSFSSIPDETSVYKIAPHWNTNGIFPSTAIGATITNNEIDGFPIGIYFKHANVSGSNEIAYNYINNTDRHTIFTNSNNSNIHDNITGSTGNGSFKINESNGVPGGDNNTINHNTIFTGSLLLSTDDTGADSNTITNNIVLFYTDCCDGNTWDYNMYGTGAAIGGNDLANTSPTYIGGVTPTTIAGFTLTSESAGYLAGSDIKNIGADVSLVGTDTDTTPPTVTAFAIPETYTSIPVPIESFTATDNVGVTGYIVTASSTAPAYTESGWTPSPPTELDFLSEGANTVYAWAKDAAGNVSTSATDDCTVTLPEPGVTWEDQPTWSVTWENQPTWSVTWE